MRDYDDWKLNSGQENRKVAFDCDHCDKEVYEGEEYIETHDGYKVHTDCFDEYSRMTLICFVGVAGED